MRAGTPAVAGQSPAGSVIRVPWPGETCSHHLFGKRNYAIYLPDLDSAPYSSLSFWINGGNSGGQRLQVYGLAHVGGTPNVTQSYFSLGTLQTNTWQQFTIPLSALGVADKINFTGFVFQDRVGAVQPTFYVDDIQLVAKPVPALVNLTLNATQAVRTVDARHFGVNLA